MRRQLTVQRTSAFQESGQFRAKVLNDELDFLTSALQQLQVEVDRTFRLKPTDRDAALTLPDASQRADHVICFDGTGNVDTKPLAALAGPNWQTLDDVPEGSAHKHFTAAERAKLTAIPTSAQANPQVVSAQEKAAANETAPRSFSPKDVGEMVAIHAAAAAAPVASVFGRTGAVVGEPGDYTADQIIDTAAKVLMTTAERSKLAGVQAGAQVNTVASVHGRTGVIAAQPGDYTADQITDTPTKVVMTAAERSKLATVQEGAQVNTVATVHGRTGAVVAEAGDYTADEITDTPTRVLMTAAERSKLSGVQAGAQVNPPVISPTEKTQAALTEPRSFSPRDVADMIAALAGTTGGFASAIDGGSAVVTSTTFIDGGLASA